MITWTTGEIVSIIRETPALQEVEVRLSDGRKEKAINYLHWQGKVKLHDRVLLNTTAQFLSLGTGGYHFIIPCLETGEDWYTKKQDSISGHIMKLRYTPLQFSVQAAEEEASPYHDLFQEINENLLVDTPVLIGELHSMLPGVCYSLAYFCQKQARDLQRIVYIMTDSASLPLAFSQNVFHLKKEQLLYRTITMGHAFGGDLECINIYSALQAAVTICQADVIVITPGPGVVGTGTRLGFSGMEQISLLQAVSLLGGNPILIPRVSFRDPRKRHQGFSHHTLTVLRFARDIPLVLHVVEEPLLMEQLEEPSPKHEIIICSKENPAWEEFQNENLSLLQTMGRKVSEDPLYFLHIFYSALFAMNRG